MTDQRKESWTKGALAAIRLAVVAAFSAAPLLALSVLGLAVVGAVLTAGVALVARTMIIGVLSADTTSVTLAAALLAGYVLAAVLVSWLNTTLSATLEERTDHWLVADVARVAAAAPDLEDMEDPEYQDNLHIVLNQRGALGGSVVMLVNTIALVARFAVTEALLAQISPVLLLFPLFSLAPILMGGQVQQILSRSLQAVAQDNRLAGKLFETATDPSAGRELRVYNLGAELVRRHSTTLLEVDRIQWSARLRATLRECSAWLVFSAGLAGAVFIVLRDGSAVTSAANLLLLFILTVQIAGQTQVAAFVVGAISRQVAIFGRYRWLRARSQRHPAGGEHAAAPNAIRTGIRLTGVTFSYPGSATPALRDVTLRFAAGTTVALVGANGAGKSTLVKLLLKLYRPTAGRIDIDETDLSGIDTESWRTALSAGFQDFARFELPASDSIGVGDLPRLGQAEPVREAMRRASVSDLAGQLPDGLDTKLGRSIGGGIDLSEGQWQKIALARAMVRDTPLLRVFDEPTASLDAETESELFASYQQTARNLAAVTGCITILVSHRYATVRHADLIVVLDGGRVLETGTHDELMRAGGRYAELFELQLSEYR